MNHAAAIEVLRRCAEALSGELSSDERRRIVELHQQALQILALPRRRETTGHLVERIAKLETQLSDREPAERVAIILERTGLKRSRYFELRKAAIQSGNFPGLRDASIRP